MSLLLETIRCNNGVFENTQLHQERMNHTRKTLWDLDIPIELNSHLQGIAPKLQQGIWKVRVLYNRTGICQVEYSKYKAAQCHSAAIISADDLFYTYKWVNRKQIDRLSRIAQNTGCDTVLIVKNNLVTDFAYANAAFFDGKNWWTPEKPLLSGIRRKILLNSGVLKIRPITQIEIQEFQCVSLINSMLPLGEITLTPSQLVTIR